MSEAAHAYAEAHAAALQMIEAIRAQIEDMDAPSDQTNWGHVGDIGLIVSKLEEVLNAQ